MTQPYTISLRVVRDADGAEVKLDDIHLDVSPEGLQERLASITRVVIESLEENAPVRVV